MNSILNDSPDDISSVDLTIRLHLVIIEIYQR